jgi:hypothetical protein
MADFVQIRTVNLEELRQALREAPDLCYKYVKSELDRGGKRFRRRLVKERLSGRPGLNWRLGTTLAKSKMFKVKVSGQSLQDLKLTVRGSSRFIPHEFGATITTPFLKIPVDVFQHSRFPKAKLKIYTATRGLQFVILRMNRPVVIPARLGYRALFNQMTPEILGKAQEALTRGIRVAFERRVKALAGAIQRLAA